MAVPTTQQRADAYWAAYFGCRIDDLHAARTLVVEHVALADYLGVYLMRLADACIVSVPAGMLNDARIHFASLPPAEAFNASTVSAYLGANVERIIGPAYQGYLDESVFHSVDAQGARVLEEHNAPALQRLAEACGAMDWGYSGIGSTARQVVFGCFVGDELAAAGMGESRADLLWHIGILTHPAYRGRGYGKALVSAITARGLELGLIPWYQTLQANASSVTIAQSLGFSQYATTLAVRLRQAKHAF